MHEVKYEKLTNLPASSEVPTRQGLLAVITSEHTLSRSREVNKHSLPPNKQITTFAISLRIIKERICLKDKEFICSLLVRRNLDVNWRKEQWIKNWSHPLHIFQNTPYPEENCQAFSSS